MPYPVRYVGIMDGSDIFRGFTSTTPMLTIQGVQTIFMEY
jgi:hypothetical protein